MEKQILFEGKIQLAGELVRIVFIILTMLIKK